MLFRYLERWRRPSWLLVLGGGALLVVDLPLFAANLTTLVYGAWPSFAVMTTTVRRRDHPSAADFDADAGDGGVPQPR